MNPIEKSILNDLRRSVLRMMHYSKSSHIGSCLSAIEILYVLYFRYLSIDPEKPRKDDRDIFILSKAHASAALYAVLAQKSFFPKSFLDSFYINEGKLPGHLDREATPGVDISAGSLGHGLPIGVGMSIGYKRKNKANKVVVLIGDGECNEGSIWEAVMLASAIKLDNLTLVVDHNNLQGFGRNILQLDNLAERFKTFGWETYDVNGHDTDELLEVLKSDNKLPKAIIAHTIKGKGISFMEDKLEWHYKSPNNQEYEQALKELEE